MLRRLVVLLCLVPFASFAEEAAAPAEPDLGKVFQLTTTGGPAAVDVDVFVNGEYALTLTEQNEWFHTLEGLLKTGENVLKVVAKPPAQPRAASEPLEIQLRAVKRGGRRVETVGRPLASLTIPTTLAAGTACEESVRFLIDPDPKPNPALKNRWYLFVDGPATAHQMTVLVNGKPVWSGNQGDAIVEVSAYLVKGKNSVTFDGRPTCLAQQEQGKEVLALAIVPARLEGDTLQATEAPTAFYDVGRDRKGESFSVQRSFRAW